MKVERIEEMRLTDADETQIGTLLDAAFGAEFDGRSYFQQRHHVRLVVRQDAVIVGHMAVALRAIRVDDALVQVAGLADVATHPDHRGKGIASILMSSAIAEARQSVATFFVLFGHQPLYAASGFVRKANRVRVVSLADARTGEVTEFDSNHLMVLPLREEVWDDTARIDLVGHAF